jgi:hypothetical protein
MNEWEKKNHIKPKKIAFVTYNRIGNGEYDNGVLKRNGIEIYIAQNGHRAKWASGGQDAPPDQTDLNRASAISDILERVSLEDMDHSYVYIGKKSGLEIISQTKNLPADKITYIMCNCQRYEKVKLIENIGNEDAKIIWCECGGRETLDRLIGNINK